MSYEGLGARHTTVATKLSTHGQIVTEDGFVGAAFKITQISRFQDPTLAAAQQIQIGEGLEIQLGGVHEAPASGNLAAAAKGNAVYIQVSNNTLGLAAQGLTTGNLNAGWLPVGIVTEIDSTRTPAVVRINATGEAKALVKVGTGG